MTFPRIVGEAICRQGTRVQEYACSLEEIQAVRIFLVEVLPQGLAATSNPYLFLETLLETPLQGVVPV